MLKVETFNLHTTGDYMKYYPIVSKWWADWKFAQVHYTHLSTTGIIINSDLGYICAGWLYKTDSGMCHLGWFISNREKQDKALRKEAIELLLNSLEETAKTYGYGLIKISTSGNNICNKIENLGYFKEENVISFLKKI